MISYVGLAIAFPIIVAHRAMDASLKVELDLTPPVLFKISFHIQCDLIFRNLASHIHPWFKNFLIFKRALLI